MSWRRGARDHADDVVADHGLHVGRRAAAQVVEPRAGHAVAAEHHGGAVVVDAERDGRLDRPVVGGADAHGRRPDREVVAGRDLDDLDDRPLVRGRRGGRCGTTRRARARRACRRPPPAAAAGRRRAAGRGAGLITQFVVMTSLRSVRWSLCRCVTSTASSIGGSTPAPARRITAPRPQSARMVALARAHERGRPGTVRVGDRDCPCRGA